MLEAYRFLDRYSLDASQLVCDEWRGAIERSSEQLALYALSVDFKHFDCERESERMGGQFYGIILDHEWEVNFANYSACFGWVNGRDFHFLNAHAPEHSSAVIRRHLRNAFVKCMSCDVMTRDFEWIVAMLLGLSDSTLVEALDVLFMREECLSLLGRFEEGLIRRKVQQLDVTVMDPLMKALVDHHSFFGRPSIQQLKKLELRIQHLNVPLEPYWLPAIYELTECRHLAIHYQSELLAHDVVDVTLIHAALHTMLQEFETIGRDIAVEHFSLTSVGIPSLVTDRKPAYESISVPHISIIDSQRWNVHHYETADKKKCLTLFVAPEDGRQWTSGHRDLHVKRGKIMDFT
ncbi:hypothetical protein AAVH_37199 [Aphelenchoides avenae]|nr:hypothetical protein AAVH_37199 [Aphelenchus avenae]